MNIIIIMLFLPLWALAREAGVPSKEVGVPSVDSNLISFIEGEYRKENESFTRSLLESLKSSTWKWNDKNAWKSKNMTLEPVSSFRGRQGSYYFFKSEWTDVSEGRKFQFEDCIWVEKVGKKFSVVGRKRVLN
jgi:hypothetical protein